MPPSITDALAAISNHKPIAQKSAEWLAARKNLIAASESGYLLGIRCCSSMINYIKAKCNLPTSLDNLGQIDSIRHGNIYEDVARAIYESRHSLEVKEYGLITTPKHSFLGASPDGIVINQIQTTGAGNGNNSKAESGIESSIESKIGRLVEIKNPYTYDPSDVIKPEYTVQILQQQYVLDLPKCDFVKTNIIGAIVPDKTAAKGLVPYRDIDAFLADALESPEAINIEIANKNISRGNLTSKGMEKGVLIHYKDTATGQYITYLYPLSQVYTRSSILEWIKTTKETISTSAGICKTKIAVEYWYLAAYFEKTLEYDSHLFERVYLPRLELIWQLINRIRQYQVSISTSSVIIHFIDNILKPHINKPAAFYKDNANHQAICNLLAAALQLEIKEISNTTQLLNDDNDDDNGKAKAPRKVKAPRKAKAKIIIEYDF
jgi:putative phage-type endonuclease